MAVRRERKRRLKNEMNVVPYIDVMLVLLVIFMVTAPLLTVGSIHLPSIKQTATVPSKPIEVQLGQNGAMAIRLREPGKDFNSVTPDHLLEAIQQLGSTDTPVVISADGKVPYEKVIALMDTIRRGGFQKIGLLVNQQH